MKRALLTTAIVLATAGTARAEGGDVTVIVQDGKVPREAVAAVRDGVATWMASASTVIITIEDGVATIDVDGRQRRVEIGAWSDPETVRRIIVHVVDLGHVVELAPLPAEAAPVEVAAPRTIVVERQVRADAETPARASAIVSVRSGHGIEGTDPWTIGVRGELGIGRGRWRAAVGLGWTHGVVHGDGTPEEGEYDAWPVSAIGGVSIGPVDVIARATIAPLHVGGVLTASSVEAGGSAALRWRRPLVGGSALAIELGCEAWQRRVAVMIGGAPVFTTPRLEPYLAVGVAWGRR